MSRPPSEMPPERGQRPGPPRPGQPGSPPSRWTRWMPWILIAVLVGGFLLLNVARGGEEKAELTYSEVRESVRNDEVESLEHDPSNGDINGKFQEEQDGYDEFSSSGPNDNFTEEDLTLFREHGVDVEYHREGESILGQLLIWLLPIGLLILVFIWFSRRQAGQMGAVMNIGRSKAKVYSTEKPRTTFSDV